MARRTRIAPLIRLAAWRALFDRLCASCLKRRRFAVLASSLFIVFAEVAIDVPFTAAWAAGGEKAFDIPAQPLEDAIHAFAEASGSQVLYETALTSGRRSTAIKGYFSTGTALRSLLHGTTLQAKETTPEAFTIFAPENRRTTASLPATGMPNRRIDMRKHGEFLGAAQTEIVNMLCRSALTRPGGYWMRLRIWIDVSGKLTEATVTESTGDAARDMAIAASLRGLTFLRPPPDIPQPLGIVIAPQDPAKTGDCSVADADRTATPGDGVHEP